MLDKEMVWMHYRMLAIPYTSSMAEVASARDRLLFLYHPNRHDELPEAEKEKMLDRYQRTQSAYHFISEHYSEVRSLLDTLH